MQTEHAVHDMRLTKENSFLAAYPRKYSLFKIPETDPVACRTPYPTNAGALVLCVLCPVRHTKHSPPSSTEYNNTWNCNNCISAMASSVMQRASSYLLHAILNEKKQNNSK